MKGVQGGSNKKNSLKDKLPFLALPNEMKSKPAVEEKEPKTVSQDSEDVMAFLESMAPSKKKDRSRSPERQRRKSRDRDRDRSKRSRSRDRSKRRSRSRDRKRRSRSRSRSRDRQRRSRSRDRKRRRSRDRNRSADRGDRSDRNTEFRRKPRDPFHDSAEVFSIYKGRVANITNFGCFVSLQNFKSKTEGLVHISQLSREGRVNSVEEVVKRNQEVFVKVLSITGSKMALSIKDVDQASGRDLNPEANVQKKPDFLTGANAESFKNPDRPSFGSEDPLMSMMKNQMEEEESGSSKKKVTRMSSPDKWELKQLIAANVIDKSELPDFDEETGLMPKIDSDEEDIEIELVEDEAPFLKGHGRMVNDLSPVRIVKNPDGSLAQAAMMQSALSKERREQKMTERQASEAANNTNNMSTKTWQDPMADKDASVSTAGGASAGYDPKSVNDLPEWKKTHYRRF